MNILELIIVAYESIKGNKLRTFLTTLGIVIGIAAVIAVMAIGQGGRAMLMQEMEKFGVNLFAVYVNYQDSRPSRMDDLKLSDVTLIKEAVPEVKYLAPMTYSSMELRSGQGSESVQTIGTTEDLAVVRNLELLHGRFINEEDQAGTRRVIVIDEDTAQSLFKTTNPVGEYLVVNNNSTLIIGVLKKDASMMSFSARQIAYIPISYMDYMNSYSLIHEFWASATTKEEVDTAMDRTIKLLERRHNAPNHYMAYSLESEMQAADNITGIISLIISCIAGISLLVGGIGVMNIMLVSVTERTREIGIRMALGAKRRDILVQFLIESVVLCILGGIIGTILGYGGAFIVAKIAHWPPLVSWSTILIAFLFSTCVGLFFGIYPANQAAKLNPIEALRRE